MCWDSADLGVTFICFSMALGPISMTFGALETGLKFDEFHGGQGEAQSTPRLRTRGQVVVIWLFSGLHRSNQTAWRSSTAFKRQQQACKIKGLRNNCGAQRSNMI